MFSRDLPIVVLGAWLVLVLCCGSPATAGTAASAGSGHHSIQSTRPAASPVDAVSRKVERLGVRLGIEVPPGAPESARVRYLSHRLERLLDAGGPGLASDGFPVHLVRYLTRGIGSLDRTVWQGQGRPLEAPEREVLERLSGVLDAIHGKLERLAERPVASDRQSRLRASAAPANDACASAVAVGNEAVSVTTVDATNDASASCGASATSPDVWFRYTAPTSGLVEFATSGSDYDPVLTLFDACPGSGGAEIACNDDSHGSTEASVFESVTVGQEVLVRVSGFSDAVGDTTLSIDLAGGISGTVTKEISGEPLAGITIRIWSSPPDTFPDASATTDASGDYSVTGLDGGEHYARAFEELSSYVSELYQEMSCASGCTIADGTPISVTLGAVTGSIDFTLEPFGAISGQITASDPMSVDPIGEVYAWHSDGGFASGIFMEADGTYRIEGLAPGTYFVTTNSYTHLDELFDDIHCHDSLCDPTTGTPVVVDPGATTSGIDFQLDDFSTITGAVTRAMDGALLSCAIEAVSTDGTVSVNGSFGSPGAYSIHSLPPTDYHVVTDCSGYFDEVWDDVQCLPGCDLSAGTPVTVPVASTVSGIDFALDELGALEGTVYVKSQGLPIPYNVDVIVMTPEGTAIDSDKTDYLGRYVLNGLYPGQYLLKAQWNEADPPPIFQAELYDNVPCAGGCSLTDGASIPVAVNTTTSGLDFHLSRCSFSSYETVESTITDSLTAQACEVLTVGPDVTITENGSAVLGAGRKVILGDGFKLEQGASLMVLIDSNLSTEDQ